MARDQKIKIRIEAQDAASREVDKVESRFSKLGSSIKANALKMTAALAGVVAAFKGLQSAANLEAQTEALRRNLAAQGQSFDTFMAKLKQAADAQISTADLIAASSRALVLGIPAEKMAELLEIARSRAIALGTDVGKAFEDLTVGLARRSIPILDNLGFTMADLQAAMDDAAAAVGKTSDQLSAQEQSAALLKGILDQGKQSVEQFGDAQSELGRKLNQANAALKDFGTFAGKVGQALTLGLAGALGNFANAMLFVVETVAKALDVITDLLSRLPLVGNAFESLNSRIKDELKTFASLRESVANFTRTASESADTMLKLALGFSEVGTSAGAARSQLSEAASSMEDVANSSKDAAEELDSFSDSVDEGGTAAAKLRDGLTGLRMEIAAAGQAATFTSAQFDALAASAGRAAAVTAALAGGATLGLGGTRVYLPGGGSRLTSSPGLTGVFFNPEKRSYVSPGGGVVFV